MPASDWAATPAGTGFLSHEHGHMAGLRTQLSPSLPCPLKASSHGKSTQVNTSPRKSKQVNASQVESSRVESSQIESSHGQVTVKSSHGHCHRRRHLCMLERTQDRQCCTLVLPSPTLRSHLKSASPARTPCLPLTTASLSTASNKSAFPPSKHPISQGPLSYPTSSQSTGIRDHPTPSSPA